MRGEVQFRSDKLAVLIDADNTSYNVIESLLKEITKFGTTYIKRVYGDWTSPQMNTWKNVLNNFAIVPIQQFGYTSGKNSTDSALIIDAMDLLYMDKLDGFCIVSSDSDFTRLAHRIRQDGVAVYGFGRRQTPKAFVAACDRFVYTELLDSKNEILDVTFENDSQPVESTIKTEEKEKLNKLLREAYDDLDPNGEKVNMGHFGNQLLKLNPSFDSRSYGYNSLGKLLKETGLFEVDGNYINLIHN